MQPHLKGEFFLETKTEFHAEARRVNTKVAKTLCVFANLSAFARNSLNKEEKL